MARLPGFELLTEPPRPTPPAPPPVAPVAPVVDELVWQAATDPTGPIDDRDRDRPADAHDDGLDDDQDHDDDERLPDAPPSSPFTVEVLRSKRRTRTVGASMVDGVLRITVPSWMSKADEAHWVEEMSRRYLRKNTTATIDLMERAVTLARRHDLPKPRTVRWVDVRTRWGSCTPAHGSIRIDRRLGAFPPWVLDYVLVHELAHLEVLDHGPAFWKLVARYGKSERAIGYLLAKSDTS